MADSRLPARLAPLTDAHLQEGTIASYATAFEANGAVLPPVANPGMITPEEECLYHDLARRFWDPSRAYIEVGTVSDIDPEHALFQPNAFRTIEKSQTYSAWSRLCTYIPEDLLEKNLMHLSLPLMVCACKHMQESAAEAESIRLDNEQRKQLLNRLEANARSAIPSLADAFMT